MCRDFDGKVTAEEVAAAANYLKNTLGKEGVQELIGNLSKDRGQSICFLLWHLSVKKKNDYYKGTSGDMKQIYTGKDSF